MNEWEAQEQVGLFIDRDEVTLSGRVANSFFGESRVNLDGPLTLEGCHIHATIFNRRGHDLIVNDCIGGALCLEPGETPEPETDRSGSTAGPGQEYRTLVEGYSVIAMTVWGIATAALGFLVGMLI